jgi:ribosomal protein S18 acetylase RimI-like enzyme
MDILPVYLHERHKLEIIEALAWKIIPEVYGTYIPLAHCQFFVKKFQSIQALEDQLHRGYEYYLLSENGMPVGYLGILWEGDCLQLSKLYLLKECRGRGFGFKAMQFVEERARQLDVGEISLIVNRKNVASIAFYEKFGFRIAEPLVSSYENGHAEKDYKMIRAIKYHEIRP